MLAFCFLLAGDKRTTPLLSSTQPLVNSTAAIARRPATEDFALPNSLPKPSGFLTLTLHAHLPYVIHHGTWPHGLEWLHEAVAETYLPFLRLLKNFEHDRIRFRCNLSLSPTLLEQLSHPTFLAEFPKYLTRKLVAAREDEAFFLQANDHALARTARFWQTCYSQALEDFTSFDRDLVRAFRHFNDIGLIDILTTAATHSYLPLLGTDESLRAQIRTAVATHTRHLGRPPRGIWAPEMGYRPSGLWNYPIANEDGTPIAPPANRPGIEQILSESSLGFFFVDTHLIENSQPNPSPGHQTLYQPYVVGSGNAPVTVFPRDPHTGAQVWSADIGYPSDNAYLDFHKKRWPGGHRYWSVTAPDASPDSKQPYAPQTAAERVQSHASHFIHLVYQTLQPAFSDPSGIQPPPILSAPFDADLFGHWWFEGIQWLDALARNLADPTRGGASGIQLISAAEYLDLYPPTAPITMPEGSWGAGGHHDVWLNPETLWTYPHLYTAELYVRDLATTNQWRTSTTAKRILQQLCRELLLLQSSDWHSLITTGAARDYAETRFLTHNDLFNELKSLWHLFQTTQQLTPAQETRLAEIEDRDNIFPDIDPTHWATP